jgi:beta-glucosidase
VQLKFNNIFLLVCFQLTIHFSFPIKAQDSFDSQIQQILSRMTLEEKIGQLVQLVGIEGKNEELIKQGRAGSILFGEDGPEEVNRIQRIAVEETRLGIPLIFATDVIHGCQTIFPIPLAEASSWNPELLQKASDIAAFEAASMGIRWTFAPMVDIARDPRWGRIMEGFGEDPFLGSVFAKAEVDGFQGIDLKDKTQLAATAKHYVAYGSAEGGRDYNTVDISERTLREVYLPPFHAAVKKNVASIMSAFNDLNGIPASANYFTLTEILRNEWKWDGVIISDWNSIGELVNHGVAKNKEEAAFLAFNAGVDIDMVGDTTVGDVYLPNLKKLVELGRIPVEKIDDAVKYVLRMKLKLGLFQNPYVDIKYFERNSIRKSYKDSIALQLAKESIVLLKNDNQTLPLDKNIKSLALIGPLADNQKDLLGSWAAFGDNKNVVSVRKGLEKILGAEVKINYAEGCEITDEDTSGFEDAINAVRSSDAVILVVGENRKMSGEAASKTNLDLPFIQEKLIKRIYTTEKPLVVVLMNGRPLTINWITENIPAVVESWFLGDQAGNAIAQVLFGEYNPSGKLPITFPRSTGQIPIYYYQKNTGRPFNEADKYTSKYLDSPNTPLYPFGFGLSYTSFNYENFRVDKEQISKTDSLIVSFDLSNTGKYEGEEIVQLYIQDEVASVTRPVKLLKGFQKIKLKPGEARKISFTISPDMLSFLDKDLQEVIEPGKFNVMIGGNSVDLISTSFEVIE